ncbi:unnamed protein product [Allacma fusca]|uniref:Integrin beta n=1 Tax=Allacma fusca TaxID=39272 RepID=A0A8J2KHX2_9HEXA|nr:unnamed protein product [Allacma fusca]
MTLSQDTSRFAVEVRNARVSGNLDAPEGGFDAIMQAIVCDQIGWRKLARRLLVFSTDASFHYAGDGKLGGIVKPNDGLCHMDSKGEYTHSTLQDYPSVAQINSKVKEMSINMIFAVTAEQIDIYKRLSQAIQGAHCGTLSSNSSNVVELVKEQYQKITSSVVLKDTATGETVAFTVKLEITECPKNRAEWQQTFSIYRVGIDESMTVDLTMLCECPCEVPGNPGFGEKSPLCNTKGTAKCGICECAESFFGRKCECDASSGSRSDDDRGCKMDNSTDIICSSRGTCVCGQCECQTRDDPNEKIDGTYCECDNFSCERENGELCSGEHGRCECGKCVCVPGWSGSACQCATDVGTCIEPGKSDVCSGKGRCECGRCVCDETETERYSGRFCQKCPTCKGRCEEYKDCVQCKVHKTGQYREEEDCERICRNSPPIEEVDVVNNEENDEHYCLFTDEDDNCRFYFVYGYDTVGSPYIKAQKTKDCPPEPPVFWIVAGVVGAIVIIGLLFLLLWKLLTHIHDRAEYARFEKERMSAKWDTGENPIYKQATSTFKNPMYSGK